ncbi:MAG: exodeoxyribonuclease alpha subunit, partial [Candidatus Binatota bacterium]|nr:exodeoxyribonuclease alpha subunit [Candidatus Binatota bacterium]
MLASLRAAGVLSGLDEHFAQAMSRISGEGRAEVLLAAALASRQVGEGNVCLDLARPPNLTDDEGTPVAPPWPAADRWTDLVRSSPLVSSTSPVPARPKANRRSASGPSPCKGEGGRRPGEGAAPTPLLLHGTRLYLRRYWEHEQLVARIVRERSTIVEAGVDDDLLASGLARLFPEAADTGPQRGFWDAPDDGQRVAAATAVRRGLAVISGGPGTGKTFTVAKVLALLVEQAFARRAAAPRIALLAPTGKAAARLQESVARAKAGLGCGAEVLAAIPDEASTIHRALSPIAGSSTRFRRRHDDPLPADVVIVDEASMVDLALMARLLDAVPASSRLILLGDKDQLASVEAGAVLADVVAAGGPSIVELSTSRRYGAASPIGELARAINAGDAAAALGVLDARAGDLELVEPPASGGLETALADRIVEIFGGVLAAERPADRLAGL